MTTIRVGYILETQFGTSDVQGLRNIDLEDGQVVHFEPKHLHPSVNAWHPVFVASDTGQFHSLPKKKRGEKALLGTNDPALMRVSTFPVKQQTRQKLVKGGPGASV